MVSKGRLVDIEVPRRPPKRAPKARILIVCEGKKTEPGYFTAFQHDVRNPRVHIDVDNAGVPMTVVERAIKLRGDADRQARAERDDNLAYDHVWGVFDVDEHPNIPQAKEKARANAIDLAVSNPCFELWALLHFQDQTAHIERDKAASALRGHMSGYEKALDYHAMKSGFEEACRRAQNLDKEAAEHDAPGRNPTTGVPRLTELIRSG